MLMTDFPGVYTVPEAKLEISAIRKDRNEKEERKVAKLKNANKALGIQTEEDIRAKGKEGQQLILDHPVDEKDSDDKVYAKFVALSKFVKETEDWATKDCVHFASNRFVISTLVSTLHRILTERKSPLISTEKEIHVLARVRKAKKALFKKDKFVGVYQSPSERMPEAEASAILGDADPDFDKKESKLTNAQAGTTDVAKPQESVTETTTSVTNPTVVTEALKAPEKSEDKAPKKSRRKSTSRGRKRKRSTVAASGDG